MKWIGMLALLLLACSGNSAGLSLDGGPIRGRDPGAVSSRPADAMLADAIRVVDAVPVVVDTMPADALPVVVDTLPAVADAMPADAIRAVDVAPGDGALTWDALLMNDGRVPRPLCPSGSYQRAYLCGYTQTGACGADQCYIECSLGDRVLSGTRRDNDLVVREVGQVCWRPDSVSPAGESPSGSWFVPDCDLCPDLLARGVL